MTILFVTLIIIASVILALIVLIQNPKGGGLAGTFGGVSSQFMGVNFRKGYLDFCSRYRGIKFTGYFFH